jgi:hypothetical protein
MNKPTECIICLEELKENYALPCGHWLHMRCVQQHFKPECPICRTPLDIQVFGVPPSQNTHSQFINPESIYDRNLVDLEFGQSQFVNPETVYDRNLVDLELGQQFLSRMLNSNTSYSTYSQTSYSRNGTTFFEIKSITTPTTQIINTIRQERVDEPDEDDEEWRNKGYLFPEEDDSYDEENPRGDNWYYDDEDGSE